MTTAPIVTFGPTEENAVVQLNRCLEQGGDEAVGVLCADHHKGYSMPIGGVLASRTVVMPAGVGYDIACGNCAVATDVKAADVDTARIMDEVWKVISFGVGRKNNERAEAAVLDEIPQSPVAMQRGLAQMASQQLGTVGSGNHYVDLFENRADGMLWVGVHFGSRGFGHKTATHFLNLAAQEYGDGAYKDDMDAPPVGIPLGTQMAEDYMAAMEIAGRYAYAGRDWVVNRVLQILGAKSTFYVHNHHNFAWWEKSELDGNLYLVVRKGATPAYPGQLGFIGGSMGDDAVIVEGVTSQKGVESFYSTVHGAGRRMGRRQAAGKTKVTKTWNCGHRECAGHAGFPLRDFRRGKGGELPLCPVCSSKMRQHQTSEIVRPGLVNYDEVKAQIKSQGIELRGGGADEAPTCYKRLPEVLDYHAGTIKILHTLRPIGVAMAGLDTFDPYKD